MLLKNQKEDTTDYTKDWPARYYDIPTGTLRREHLKRAKAEGFAVPADSYREMLCERRFFSEKKDGTVDGFFRAWTMIKASAAAGVSFFQKKRQKKELLTYMKDLCLSPDDLLPDLILKKEIGKVVDWSKVDKEDYLLAMERSPIRDIEIKYVLKNALTNKIDDREVYMKGIDTSYYYEGYTTFKTEDLK